VLIIHVFLFSFRFDICFGNNRAVRNSKLLREYAFLNERVTYVMILIKIWAKAGVDIASAADGTLSSYTWMNLVIFYLQVIDFVPNLQSKDLIGEYNRWATAGDGRWERRPATERLEDSLDYAHLTAAEIHRSGIWRQPEHLRRVSVSSLLLGFFEYYAFYFNRTFLAISIRVGRPTLLKTAFRKAQMDRFCIEDPFETHASSEVHDLGMHASEDGQRWITEKMQCSAEAMKKIIVKIEEEGPCREVDVDSINFLWGDDAMHCLGRF